MTELEVRLSKYWNEWRFCPPATRFLLQSSREILETLLTRAFISNNVLDWGAAQRYNLTGWKIVTESTPGGPVYALERVENPECRIDFGV